MIANKIKKLYPSAVINEDYKIEFENLSTNDIVQGKELKIKIKPTKNSKVKEELNFIVKINYKYDAEEQKRAATGILRKAIPTEFWNDRKNNKYLAIWRAEGRYATVTSMIQNVRPLPILLSEPHFASKIIIETFAASYWTNYHTQFWGLWVNADNGYWPQYTTIPSSDDTNKIKNVKILSELNNTYFNKLFFVIEKYLNDSGIKCRISKKVVKDWYSSLYLYGVGNIQFNNQYDDYDNGKKRQYYIQVNFDVLFFDNNDSFSDISQEFAGVVFTLSDELDLYS